MLTLMLIWNLTVVEPPPYGHGIGYGGYATEAQCKAAGEKDIKELVKLNQHLKNKNFTFHCDKQDLEKSKYVIDPQTGGVRPKPDDD